MAHKHSLAIDIPDTACENTLRIVDVSIYDSLVEFDCPRLDIYLPGFSEPIYYTDLTEGFIKNLSTQSLGLSAQENPINNLPDGLYTIRYSVSPNTLVYVQYYHLRVTYLTNVYYREICKIQMQACEPTAEQIERMKDLRYIKMYIDAAKAKAEYCHSPKQAIEMYTYAERLLAKYQSGACVSCN